MLAFAAVVSRLREATRTWRGRGGSTPRASVGRASLEDLARGEVTLVTRDEERLEITPKVLPGAFGSGVGAGKTGRSEAEERERHGVETGESGGEEEARWKDEEKESAGERYRWVEELGRGAPRD